MKNKAEILEQLIKEARWAVNYHEQKLKDELELDNPDDVVINWHTKKIQIEHFKIKQFNK
jgi:hypothetical protein